MPNPELSELIEAIAPFANDRINRPRDPNARYGGSLPRTAGITIHTPCRVMHDADIRGVSRKGIERFFYGSCELIAWIDVRKIIIFALDENGNQTGAVVIFQAERTAA